MVADTAAQSLLGVQQTAGVAARDGHPHVVVGGRQTLLDRSGAGEYHRGHGEHAKLLGYGASACTYTQPLSVDHQVNVFVDFAIFVVRLWALAGGVVSLDVGAVAAI